ncbi:hypothetical protein [Paraclostridium bifermentans]|uniref:hypothetical protein n=1 Tax=Paraclostridium bifermentans TaxID=1490 RepID=UPI001C80DB14|nr:hypothetical protein [Paraclostridium bifermentans]GIM32977.1 hypothetical protein PAGU1678_22470 [Paraclostridium bifermentans subsp. muricolitidis]
MVRGIKENLVGKKYGLLTVIDAKREKNKTYYLCRCDCGNEKWIRSDGIKNGRVTSCGCNHYVNLLDKKIGRLKVIEKTDRRDKKGAIIWKCRCDCGNLVEKSTNVLKFAKSCGCLKSEKNKERSDKMRKVHLEKNVIENVNVAAIKKDTLFKHNTSGVTGVFYDSHNKKWGAQIYFKNKCHRLGLYKTKEDAIKARKDAEEKLHKKFLREKGLLD